MSTPGEIDRIIRSLVRRIEELDALVLEQGEIIKRLHGEARSNNATQLVTIRKRKEKD